MSPARACNGCGRITSGRYCDRCKHLDTGARGSTRAWRELRAAAIAAAQRRAELRCAECKTALTGGRDTHLDHKVAKRAGGTDHPSNLRLLCAGCNLRKGAR